MAAGKAVKRPQQNKALLSVMVGAPVSDFVKL